MINQNKEINYSKIADKETQNLIFSSIQKIDTSLGEMEENLPSNENLNSDISSPLNQNLWLLDYKIFGEESYVFNDKNKLHALYQNYILCANDKMIGAEAFDYNALNSTGVNFLAYTYGLTNEEKELIISLETLDNMVNNETAMAALSQFSMPIAFMAESQTMVNLLSNSSIGMEAIANSENASKSLCNSKKAMNILAASTVAMEKLANSSYAMNAITSNWEIMEIIAQHQESLDACWNNTIAVNAICASSQFKSFIKYQTSLNSFGYAASNAGSAYSVWNGRKTFIYNGQTIKCAYSGDIKNVILPPGTYKLQVYGAQGGAYASSTSYVGGKGGYSVGNKVLTSPTTLYVVAGGQGTTLSATGAGGAGYNGGGKAYTASTSYKTAGGGGATHISTKSGLLSALGTSNLSSILIVAGGGGASGNGANGGAGGGTSGSAGTDDSTSYSPGGGGTQSAAGASYYQSTANSTTYFTLGSFGQGASGKSSYVSGGGGGLYGGGGAYYASCGAGGGSGYIGGVTEGSMTNGSRAGNGQAIITRVSA